MTQKPVIYRVTGAAPGSAAVISNLYLGAWDSNASLALHPVRVGDPGRSYVATLALGFEVDPTVATSFRIWPTLVGGSLDADVDIKIATTLATTYIQATGTQDDHGDSISTVYSLTAEDFFNYTAGSPKVISGTDMVKTTGTGVYTKYIPLQIEIGDDAALGAHPQDPVELKINVSALESS